ncbi:MAG: alkaline phosphatase family protein [Acidobacteria bacterium]|nr:alkaline phosphatase family protein [Acidobacteriota bacterium]
MKSLNFFVCFVISVCFVFSPQQKQQKQETKPKFEKVSSYLIVVTISGLKAEDVNDNAANRLRIPTLQSLRTKGAYAVSVESVYPSLINPAHATIASGALPADHGITSDFPFNEQSGSQSEEPYRLAKEIKTDTIWDAAKRGGLVTAAVGYPLTAGATIDFNLPVAFDEGLSDETESGIRQIISKQFVNPPDLLDRLTPEILNSPFAANKKLKEIAGNQRIDHCIAVAAANLIEKQRPNLLLINFNSYAKSVKKYGVQSREAILALEFIDDLLKKIIDSTERAQLTNELTIFVVTDFGSMNIEQIFNPNVVLAKKGFLTTGGEGRITSWRAVAQTFGGSAAIFVRDRQDEKTSREVEKVFTELHEKPDSPIWRVVSRREASQLGADPRAVLYLDAAPSYAMSSRATGSTISKTSDRAAHGFLPSRSEIRATLIISGKGIKNGAKIEYARLIDIAPTAARLLGLEMRTARGRVFYEVISQ